MGKLNKISKMKTVLSNILDHIKEVNGDSDYSQAIYSMMCGIGTSEEYKKLLFNWFVDPMSFYDKLDDVENVSVYSITNLEFKVLVFSDGYDGYFFTFGIEGDKLRLMNYKRIDDEEDSIYEKDELSDSEIEEILNN